VVSAQQRFHVSHVTRACVRAALVSSRVYETLHWCFTHARSQLLTEMINTLQFSSFL